MRRIRRTLSARAHPRAGGENAATARVGPLERGSSPRGRGKLDGGLRALQGGGLIPARAGKTVHVVSNQIGGWAHPRAGGENLPKDATTREMRGSSPRGRGKRS